MYLPLLILIVIIAFALILIIMVQNPKGGGLSSSFGGNVNTIGGVQNTNTFLDRATWVLAISLFSLILLSKFTINKDHTSNSAEDQVTDLNTEVPASIPAEKPVDNATKTVETPKKEEAKK